MTEKLKSLRHEPYGFEHPYKQKAWERFPRDPQAGEEVILGIMTAPAGSAESVTVTWTVDGQEMTQTTAEPIDKMEEGSLWQAALPSVDPGKRVTYQIQARQGEQCVESLPYAYFTPYCLTTSQVSDYHLTASGLELTCLSADGTFAVKCRMQLDQEDKLTILWDTGKTTTKSVVEETAEPIYQVLKESASGIRLSTGKFNLVVEFAPFQWRISKPDGSPLLIQEAPPAWFVDENGEAQQLRQRFNTAKGEAFYGFGERFNALDQRGQTLDVRVYEEYKEQGKHTYIPIPFHLSSRGYGFYVNTNRYVTYDLDATCDGCWSYRAELNDGVLISEIFVDEDPWQIVSAFTRRIAAPELPPAWAFGPWMSSNDWNSQQMVLGEVALTQKYQIPATVMVIEAWSDENTFYIWNDAQYEPKPGAEALHLDDFTFPADGLWPDPLGMIEALHASGLRLVLWQIPVMKKLDEPHAQHDLDEVTMLAENYCVQQADGAPYKIRPFWFHDGLLLDVTNQDALDWWFAKRDYLLTEMSVDGFKTDGGEHLWGRDTRFGDGRRGAELWNLYPNLYAGAYYKFANEKRGGEAITFSRAGYTGAQAFPCHWAGDENSTWDAFRASILAGLSAGISGIPFWGWDIGGFSGDLPTADLYLRSTAMAAFCPIMQYHSEFNARRQPSRDRTPWNIQACTGDPDVIDTFRFFAKLRMNLLPYIMSEAWHASQSGIPMMRALVLAYPNDPVCRQFPYQYLFGSSLLVAPVVNEGVDLFSVYLPAGQWIDFWTDEPFYGGRIIEYSVPKDRIPVFVRAGSIISFNFDDSLALAGEVGNAVDSFQNLCFKIYPKDEQTAVWYDHVEKKPVELSYTWDSAEEILTLDFPILHPFSVLAPGKTPQKVIINGQA